MDKNQKELINTYFRKRLLVSEDKYSELKYYESEFIVSHPELFDIENVRITGIDWLDDIIKHPDKIPEYDFKNNDGRFYYIEPIVSRYVPELIEYFDLDRLQPYLVHDILIDHPELITYFPRHKLNEIEESPFLSSLLISRPILGPYFNLNKIEHETTLSVIIEGHPENALRIDTTKLSSWTIIMLLRKNPIIIRYLRIKDHPKYNSVVKQLMEYPSVLINILENPQTSSEIDFDSASDIPEFYIVNAIIAEPGLIKYIDVSNMSSSNRYRIVNKQPELIKYIDVSDFFTDNIVALLFNHPQLFREIKYDFSKLYKDDVIKLLKLHPEFFDKIHNDASKSSARYNSFDLMSSEDIIGLLKVQPSLEPKLKPYIDRIKKIYGWYNG
jgi:hypothetical protein